MGPKSRSGLVRLLSQTRSIPRSPDGDKNSFLIKCGILKYSLFLNTCGNTTTQIQQLHPPHLFYHQTWLRQKSFSSVFISWLITSLGNNRFSIVTFFLTLSWYLKIICSNLKITGRMINMPYNIKFVFLLKACKSLPSLTIVSGLSLIFWEEGGRGYETWLLQCDYYRVTLKIIMYINDVVQTLCVVKQ